MTIGILYESEEWSTYAIRDDIVGMGVPAKLIDMREAPDSEELLSCRLVLSRVFASAVFRGHKKALDNMPAVIDILRKHKVRMINPAEAHYYEISKTCTKEKLNEAGFPVPKLYDADPPAYPCIVKPDCGGRTSHTYIVHNALEREEIRNSVPGIVFITEEYIRPEFGYVTRLEIIDRSCKLALKRSVTEDGLSAYHLGSEYRSYKDISPTVTDAAVKAMGYLSIEAGSMDIIENSTGWYIIDVNSVSNASEDNTEMFGFDLMKETAAYAVKIYYN